jgi:hypothetical protein
MAIRALQAESLNPKTRLPEQDCAAYYSRLISLKQCGVRTQILLDDAYVIVAKFFK